MNWKNLSVKRKEKANAYVSKAITGNCPNWNITEKFKISNSERYDLRSNNIFLALPKPKTNSMVRTFGYATAKIWNERNKVEWMYLYLCVFVYFLFNIVTELLYLLTHGRVPNEKQSF
jgi:hypothetical protein